MALREKFCWTYETEFSASDCISAILCAPLTFGNDYFNPHYYDCAIDDQNSLLITFRGPKFGKVLHTEYIMYQRSH